MIKKSGVQLGPKRVVTHFLFQTNPSLPQLINVNLHTTPINSKEIVSRDERITIAPL